MRTTFGVLLFLTTALVAVAARASDSYPDAIKTDLMTPTSPACDLCHNGGVGQKGNVSTPFGKAATALGLVSGDTNALKTVLDAMKAANTDSDGDGTSDIDELSKGTNPNFNEVTGMAPGGADFPPPEYGCRIAWRAPGGRRSCAVGLALLAGFLLWRARRSSKARGGWENAS